MKRLILMGGRPWLAADKGEQFVQRLFRYHSSAVHVAFCIFAQQEDEWEETRRINVEMFERFAGKRKVSTSIMTPENFAELSKQADVIYLPGGNPYRLIEKIKTCGNVRKLWEGKVIAGASAGADLFCVGFPYLQERTFGEGLGWVKLSCIPHWRSDFEDYTDADWDWAEQESLKRLPGTPVLCLSETDFVEMSIG